MSKQLRVSRPKLVSFFAKQSAATVSASTRGLPGYGRFLEPIELLRDKPPVPT